MLKKEKIQSAAFKRNTLTIIAVMLFALIVLSEILLAFSIPWYLQREDTMALQVLRLNMRATYDAARIQSGKSNRDEVRQAELRLIRWSLDSMADYLRANMFKFNAEELKYLQDNIVNMLHTVNKIQSGHSYSREQRLDTSVYINSLINQGNTNAKRK